MRKETDDVRLGLSENRLQFYLLVLVNAFIGGMVGKLTSISVLVIKVRMSCMDPKALKVWEWLRITLPREFRSLITRFVATGVSGNKDKTP